MSAAIRLAALLLLWLGPIPGFAADPIMGHAIDMAGRQRMLTQRIIKAYCQIGLGLQAEDARRQLAAAVTRFDSQLAELRAFARDEPARAALDHVERVWQPFRAVATGPVSREGARALAQDDGILHATHAVVLRLQEQAGTPQARLVNIAGRQRMLTQRLAKFYLLRAWVGDPTVATEEMAIARDEFAGALAELRAAPPNTAAINALLDEVALQWEWFGQALSQQGGRGYERLVAETSEGILARMEAVTAMYAALP